MGDVDDKVGNVNIRYERTMVKEGCGSMSNNGETAGMWHDVQHCHRRDTVGKPRHKKILPGVSKMAMARTK